MKKQDWTTTELAKYLGMADAYIRQLILKGELKAHKRGHYWLIPDREVQSWLKNRKRKK